MTNDMRDTRAQAGAIIVGAGRAARMGGLDKVFAPLRGRPVFAYALAAFDRCDDIERTVLVVPAERAGEARSLARELALTKPFTCVAGGERRRDSVAAGLRALDGCQWALVHDAARPLVTPALIAAALAAARATGAAIPGVPPVDTIKVVDERERVCATPGRATLRAIQTPQAFRRELLVRAYAASDDDATDDATLVERLGVEVAVFPGDPRNIKITHPHDLAVAAALLGEGFGLP